MRLAPLLVWFQPAPGALLPQLEAFLAAEARVQEGPGASLLRWAITATNPEGVIQIEAVLVVEEAVLVVEGGEGWIVPLPAQERPYTGLAPTAIP